MGHHLGGWITHRGIAEERAADWQDLGSRSAGASTSFTSASEEYLSASPRGHFGFGHHSRLFQLVHE
jgi:hypothetical protein